MEPRVTIGMCVRNCEGLVGDAIASIMAQDFPHDRVKVVFVDDGSEDRTLSIIQDCVHKMDVNTVVFHTPWKGLGSARNTVIAHAEGDYIIWVDGDMIISRDYLRKLVQFMDKHSNVGITKGEYMLQPGGNLLATLEAYSRAANKMVNYESEKARSKPLGTGGCIYRIEAAKQVGGFDENLKWYGEDSDIEIRIRAAGWLLTTTIDAGFLDYERKELSWKDLWNRYWLRGYHTHYFLHKNKGLLKHYRMFPPAASLSGLLSSFTLFKLTRQRTVFLMSFQSTFKMTAWYVGFMRSHLDGYSPKFQTG